jgi:asparagine synthase (glutamine-hydrolysing)
VSTPRLTPLELAAGFPRPDATPTGPGPTPKAGFEPLAAFRAVVRAALKRPPCLVSFSGGRDSSAVLAVAAASAVPIWQATVPGSDPLFTTVP